MHMVFAYNNKVLVNSCATYVIHAALEEQLIAVESDEHWNVVVHHIPWREKHSETIIMLAYAYGQYSHLLAHKASLRRTTSKQFNRNKMKNW